MFWDKVSSLYDFFETVYNGKVYNTLGKRVSEEIEINDTVLECACGTGAISKFVAPVCRLLIATDFSVGMLKQTEKKCRKFSNIKIKRADILHLKFKDDMFDKVIAGNVIHLLPKPYDALNELNRVCKKDGKIIIPTYINMSDGKKSFIIRFLEFLGADFKRQFDFESYKEFFNKTNFKNIAFYVIDGRMPCAVAVITK